MIKIENLKISLGDNPVLTGVDLEIREGETLVIIGRSGCGKSVLLKNIIGLMKPDSGRILIEEHDITHMSEKRLNILRRKIGILFQGAALFDSVTVGENVGFSLLEQFRMKPQDIAVTVKEKLRLVGLADVSDKMPADLSGGMKKRVGLARAIATDPRIVLYDEPTTGLDPIMADAINELIIELKQKLKVTSVVVTHDMTSAYKIADRLAMLYDGKIIFEGTPDEIRSTNNPFVRQFITGSARGPITNGNSANHIHV